MLVHVSGGSYLEGLKMADYFVTHVEVVFAAIDDLVAQYQSKGKPEPKYRKESKLLCRKIINFFTLLSHARETGLRPIGLTEELLSLVTGLAHYLKVLIRISLTAALNLVSIHRSFAEAPTSLQPLMILVFRTLHKTVRPRPSVDFWSNSLSSPISRFIPLKTIHYLVLIAILARPVMKHVKTNASD